MSRPEYSENFLSYRRGVDLDKLFSHLTENYTRQDILVPFEAQLEQAGLLPKLEQAGLLPVVECPNPFDSNLETQQYEQWWIEHPKEGERFDQWSEKRTEILGYLYVGATLGHLLNDVPRPRPPSSEPAPYQGSTSLLPSEHPPLTSELGAIPPSEAHDVNSSAGASVPGDPSGTETSLMAESRGETPANQRDPDGSRPKFDNLISDIVEKFSLLTSEDLLTLSLPPEITERIPPDIRKEVSEFFSPIIAPELLTFVATRLSDSQREQLFAEWRNPGVVENLYWEFIRQWREDIGEERRREEK